MVNRKKKGKYIGMAGALVVHVAIIALLILVGFTLPEPSEEGGVPVMLGEVPDALGAADPSLVKVDVMPEETAPQVQETVEQDIITQETEETVAIKPKAEPKKKEEVKKPEKTEAEKAEEARKLAAAKAERERKEAEEAARKRVAGAFGKVPKWVVKAIRKAKVFKEVLRGMLRPEPLRVREATARLIWADVLLVRADCRGRYIMCRMKVGLW